MFFNLRLLTVFGVTDRLCARRQSRVCEFSKQHSFIFYQEQSRRSVLLHSAHERSWQHHGHFVTLQPNNIINCVFFILNLLTQLQTSAKQTRLLWSDVNSAAEIGGCWVKNSSGFKNIDVLQGDPSHRHEIALLNDKPLNQGPRPGASACDAIDHDKETSAEREEKHGRFSWGQSAFEERKVSAWEVGLLRVFWGFDQRSIFSQWSRWCLPFQIRRRHVQADERSSFFWG